MKIELKKIKTNLALSQETICFSADVYVEGKLMGHAMNHGHGGESEVRVVNRELFEKVQAYIKTLPKVKVTNPDMELEKNLDWIMADLVQDHFKAKEDAKFLKKGLKEKARLASLGYNVCLEFRCGDSIVWSGCPNETHIEKLVAHIKTKYKFNDMMTYKTI